MQTTDFQKLDEQVQKDLIEFYNVHKSAINDDDKQLLADLYNSGNFEAWECEKCDDARCIVATPDNWDSFQGTSQQDYTSYPAQTEKAKRWCNHCRAFKQ